VANRFPDAREIRLVWHYLVPGLRVTSDRTAEEIERHRRQMIGLIDTIEETKDFPARVSALCSWCEYRDICPAQKDLVKAGPPRERKPARSLDKAEQIALFE
jgi:hypothetical protein